jgi:hypothetical protein
MSNLSKLSRYKRTDAAKRKLSNQPARTEANRLAKRIKHLKRQPHDLQTKALIS